MKITAHKLKDVNFGDEWASKVLNRWNYEDFRNDRRWREGWISFDCAHFEPAQRRVYLGITSFDADIFRAFDCVTKKFIDLGYGAVANPFDAKFHRSLVKTKDNTLIGAAALLHDVDDFWRAPGSPLIRYNLADGGIERLPAPLPHIYIQALSYDERRHLLYLLCFPPEKVAVINLKTGEVTDLGLIGSGYGGMTQGENIELDDDGCLWCNWSVTRAWQYAPGPDANRICRFDPEQKRFTFFKTGLPKPDGTYGTARVEAWFNFSDGHMYASGANGSFYRVNRETGEAKLLFTPTPDRPSRLTSLVKVEPGIAYGVTGREGWCELMRVNYLEGTFEKIGTIEDASGERMWQCHHIVYDGAGTLYACENDNPKRSSYLWEIKL
jgi:hypothetical protein